jgi:hypothetical protein
MFLAATVIRLAVLMVLE